MKAVKKLFEPENEEPLWKLLYEVGEEAEIGDVLTWALLKSKTGLNIQKYHRGLIYDANKQLLPDHQKMFMSVRNVGYRIAKPGEQLKHSINRRTRAGRQIKKGITEAENVKKSEMTVQEKEKQTQYLLKLQHSLTAVRKHNVEALNSSKNTTKKTEEAIAHIDKVMKEIKGIKENLKK